MAAPSLSHLSFWSWGDLQEESGLGAGDAIAHWRS